MAEESTVILKRSSVYGSPHTHLHVSDSAITLCGRLAEHGTRYVHVRPLCTRCIHEATGRGLEIPA